MYAGLTGHGMFRHGRLYLGAAGEVFVGIASRIVPVLATGGKERNLSSTMIETEKGGSSGDACCAKPAAGCLCSCANAGLFLYVG